MQFKTVKILPSIAEWKCRLKGREHVIKLCSADEAAKMFKKGPQNLQKYIEI